MVTLVIDTEREREGDKHDENEDKRTRTSNVEVVPNHVAHISFLSRFTLLNQTLCDQHRRNNLCSKNIVETVSRIRTTFLTMSVQSKTVESVEKSLNRQINLHQHVSLVYLHLAFHFDRHDIARAEFVPLFKQLSTHERDLAMRLMSFLNERGASVVFPSIPAPITQDWCSTLRALETAERVYDTVHQALLDLQLSAEQREDFLAADFLSQLVDDQAKAMEKTQQLINLEKKKHVLFEGVGAKKA